MIALVSRCSFAALSTSAVLGVAFLGAPTAATAAPALPPGWTHISVNVIVRGVAHTFVYDGAPDGFHEWGIHGALQFLYGYPAPALLPVSDSAAPAAIASGAVRLVWDPAARKLLVIAFKIP